MANREFSHHWRRPLHSCSRRRRMEASGGGRGNSKAAVTCHSRSGQSVEGTRSPTRRPINTQSPDVGAHNSREYTERIGATRVRVSFVIDTKMTFELYRLFSDRYCHPVIRTDWFTPPTPTTRTTPHWLPVHCWRSTPLPIIRVGCSLVDSFPPFLCLILCYYFRQDVPVYYITFGHRRWFGDCTRSEQKT